MSEQHPDPNPNPNPSPTPNPNPSPDPAPDPNTPAPDSASLLNTADPATDTFDPEKITFPEGFEKSPHFDAFKDLAKESGLSQSAAQKLIDLYGNATKGIYDAWAAQNTDWQNAVKSDQEIGGQKLDVVKQTISKVLDNSELSDPKFREALDFTGAGNHPAVVRTLYRWAQKLTEGGSVAGDAPARGRDGGVAENRPSLAGSIYGSDGPRSGGPFR